MEDAKRDGLRRETESKRLKRVAEAQRQKRVDRWIEAQIASGHWELGDDVSRLFTVANVIEQAREGYVADRAKGPR